MTEIIDYAMPMMNIEKFLKDTHNYLLDGKMEQAQEKCLLLATEAKILSNTLVLMKEKQNAIREQTPALREGIPAATGEGRTT
jgi:hypothetical protein